MRFGGARSMHEIKEALSSRVAWGCEEPTVVGGWSGEQRSGTC